MKVSVYAHRRKMQSSRSDKIFDTCNFIFLAFIFLIVAYPLIYIISCSFSDAKLVMAGKIWFLPKGFNLEAYKSVLSDKSVLMGYYNSFIYTIAGTTLNIIFTLLAAYPLSRRDFRGGKLITFLFTFTMMFSGGLIPTYQVVQNLGLLDTRLSIILPGLIVVWNLIVAKTFFQASIPFELYEAAGIDGAGDIRTFVSIVLPVSKPIIAVIALYYAVGHWNAFFDAMIYLKTKTLYPLQIILRNILILNEMGGDVADLEELADLQAMSALLKYSLIIVATIPVMVLYPFIQKYFVKGIMIGAVKG